MDIKEIEEKEKNPSLKHRIFSVFLKQNGFSKLGLSKTYKKGNILVTFCYYPCRMNTKIENNSNRSYPKFFKYEDSLVDVISYIKGLL